jgi:N,N'-diacetyllegionaminate synthase
VSLVEGDNRVLVVAEIGNNHEGDPVVARELIRAAVDAGAHAVKLQVFEARRFVRRRDEKRFRQLSSYQLPRADVEALAELTHELGALFLATPFDLDSAAFLRPLVDGYKIASGDNDFWPLIELVAGADRPLVVSTGLLDLDGTEALARRVLALGPAELTLLHCVAAYPAPPEELNLAAIPLLAERLPCGVGYSDHALGIEAAVLAASLGARVIEKHFTLRHDFSDFHDHRLSANPEQLRELVERVAQPTEPARQDPAVGAMLGQPEKHVQAGEAGNALAARRSIAAAADLPRGHRLRLEDLAWLRPRDGLAPGQEGLLLGHTLRRDVPEGDSILAADVS